MIALLMDCIHGSNLRPNREMFKGKVGAQVRTRSLRRAPGDWRARPSGIREHQELDRAVDRCYRAESFLSVRHRVEYRFALCEKLTASLVAAARPARKARKLKAVA
jgi:MmeI, C-terminal domain